MGAQGTATLDFGVFPGSSVAITDVVATGVISTSAVEAWIRPTASADHTDMDHVVANMRVVGQYLSDNNIRIFGVNNNDVLPPSDPQPVSQPTTSGITRQDQILTRQSAPMLVGIFNVNWVWN